MTQAAERLHGTAVAAPPEEFAPDDDPRPSERVKRAGERGGSAVARVVRVLLGLGLVFGVGASVALGARRYAHTSERFTIRKIEVEGGRRFGPEGVLARAGIPPDANLFALDTSQVESSLLEDPWIAEAKVVVRLPSTLKVILREREARAIAIVSENPYLVSAQAEPFKRLQPGEAADLPVITGIDSDELIRNRRQELKRVALGLEVIDGYERLPISQNYPVQEVHLALGGSVSLCVGKQGIWIFLGKDSFRQRLLMAERVVLEARRAGKLPGLVFADNVAHPERVVVRLR